MCRSNLVSEKKVAQTWGGFGEWGGVVEVVEAEIELHKL
jgi:hypothetical protein